MVTAAFCKTCLTEGPTSGELSDPAKDCLCGDVFGVKWDAMPAFEFAMLLVVWIGYGIEEQFESGDATDIFRRSAACAVDVAGIFDGRIGVGDRLDRDRVSPVVAEVVGIG